MPLDQRSAQAFHAALQLLTEAKLAAATDEDQERIEAEERKLLAARKREIQGDFASRTFYFNIIASRLSAVNGFLTADPYRKVKVRMQDQLLELRENLMHTAVKFLHDLNTAVIPEDPDEEHEDLEAVAASPAPKTAEPEDDENVPQATPRANAAAAATDAPSQSRADLKADYETLFAECAIRPDCLGKVNWHVGQLQTHQSRYESVGQALGIPWWFIGGIHMLETGFTFDKHLHNGDSLAGRTTRVPSGRPQEGDPPFAWKQSAFDALRYKQLETWKDWSIAGALYQWERYNGFGYRKHHPEVASPYLWSFSHHYTSGKYVADGQFDAAAVSKQCGAATLLRALVNRGLVFFA